MMPNQTYKTRVVFSVTNCICHDQRVHKIAETVSKLNCDITLIGRRSGDCCRTYSGPFITERFRMIFKKGFFFYAFFNLRLFFYLLFNKYDLLVSNDLDTLLPNFLVSKLKRIPLIYDSHEYFTGVPEIQNRPFVKWIWKSIERIIFPHLKYIMTVNDSIAILYENEYGIRPYTIRNCSPKVDGIIGYSREELGIDKDHLLLILQGTGINIDRGGEELIDAIYQSYNISLLIVGAGDKLEALKDQVQKMNIAGKVKFFPKVPWNELIRYTKSADAGLTLDKDTNLNYRFILPNKLFEFINSGIPVIASSMVEVKKIVTDYNCGIIISNVTPEEIRKAMEKLRDNRNLLSELKRNAILASEKLNWELESEKVIELYKTILNSTDIMSSR
jgi:glycosyltransferase involved in cell wall biosynthesis